MSVLSKRKKHLFPGFFLLLPCLIFHSFTAVAQRAIIKGTVKNDEKGETLVGVTIDFGKGIGTVTDENGNYHLEVPQGKYAVTFSYLGYQKQHREIIVKAGDSIVMNIQLQEVTNELNLVVVSASKYEKNITDETVSMEVLKPDMLRNTNPVALDDALKKVPGVNIIENQANIRGGSGWSYGAGSRVLILVDDIPELTGDAADVKWEFLPIENLNQVEIIKGASSVLYGSSALNGVINLRTAYPTAKPETQINLYQGIYANPKYKYMIWWGNRQPYFNGANFFHSQKFGQFDLVVGGNLYSESGFHEGEYTQRGRINANTRYRFKNIDGLSAGINTNYMYYHSGTYFLWADDSLGALRPFGGTDSATTTNTDGKNTRFNVDPFITYYSHNGDHHDLRFRYFYTNNNNNTGKSSISNWYYGQYYYQKKFDDNLNLTAGAMGSFTNVKSVLYGGHDGNNFAVFAQLDKKIGNFTVVAGLRYETFKVDSARGNSKPVFRAGINYPLNPTTFLRASFGQGYRFPSIAEKYVSTDVGAVKVFPNPEVQPEKGWSAEVGIKKAVRVSDWQGYVDLAAFMQRYQNLIEFRFGYYPPEPTPGEYDFTYIGFESVNIENASVTGTEFTVGGQGKIGNVNANILAGIDYISPINITQKKYVDSILGSDHSLSSHQIDSLKQTKILNYRFKTTFKINADLSYRKFSFGAEMRYNSFMVNIDPFFLGTDPLLITIFGKPTELIPGIKEWREAHHHGDYVIDLRFSYDISDNVRVSFITKNLLNRAYSIRPALMEAQQSFQLQVGIKL